jgi:hypothetical protein
MSFDLSSMERGELCHGQFVGLLLADYMQDIGAAKSNVRGGVVRALDLSPGFGEFKNQVELTGEVKWNGIN